MDLWHWLGGTVTLRLTGADLSTSLNRINQTGYSVFDIAWQDELNCHIRVNKRDLSRICEIVERRGDQVTVLRNQGFPQLLQKTVSRPVLVSGLVFFFVLNLYLPSRVLFLKVEGNHLVPTQKILEEASQIGLRFWSDRSELRSEKIKNALLEAIPQLQWAGVNTAGCVATISVRERQTTQQLQQGTEVSSLAAVRDGVVSSVTATRGNPVCKIGQAVQAGEVLISGYTDCGITIHATRAEGEVYGYTKHTFQSVVPALWQKNSTEHVCDTNYTLIIGKKRINFSKTSGISDPTCGKMKKEYHLELPGGFRLPVTLEIEFRTDYATSDVSLSEQEAQQILSDSAKENLLGHMVAGQILQADELISAEDGVYLLDGAYACTEMISLVRKEEHYGEYN